jgi:hypothetical protein
MKDTERAGRKEPLHAFRKKAGSALVENVCNLADRDMKDPRRRRRLSSPIIGM